MVPAVVRAAILQSALTTVFAFTPSQPRCVIHPPPRAPRSALGLSLVPDEDAALNEEVGEGDLTLGLFSQEMARSAAADEAEAAAAKAEAAEDAASRLRQKANYAKNKAKNNAEAMWSSNEMGSGRLSEQSGGQIIQNKERSAGYSELSRTHVRRLVDQFGEEATRAERHV